MNNSVSNHLDMCNVYARSYSLQTNPHKLMLLSGSGNLNYSHLWKIVHDPIAIDRCQFQLIAIQCCIFTFELKKKNKKKKMADIKHVYANCGR